MIRFGQKTLATFLILSSFFAGAERAHAIVAVTPASDILQIFDTIVNTIGNGLDAVTSYASMSLAQKEIIWDGVGLVDYCFAPHYKSDHPESSLVDKMVEYFVENKMPFKTLRDGEVIIETS